MGVYDNSPSLSYVRANGINVVYNDEVYSVSDFYSNKKYFYWNSDMPYQLNASQTMPERSNKQFLVLVNDNGVSTHVPSTSDNFGINYDGNSVEAIRDRIFGLYEKNEEANNKFVVIEQNIDGIKQVVGEHGVEGDTLINKVSKIEQDVSNIDLSVKNIEKTYEDDKETNELRDNLNKSIINLNSDLGIFKGDINTYFKDSIINNDEKISITAHEDNLSKSLRNVFSNVDLIIVKIGNEGNQNDISALNNSKGALQQAHDNLISLLNTAISDGTIIPSEITIITDCFAKYNLKINELKNTCDDIILLGMGGSISEELARIGIKSDEITLSVHNVNTQINGDNGIEERLKMAEQTITPDGITQIVKDSQIIKDMDGKITSNTEKISEVEQTSSGITSSVKEIKDDMVVMESQIQQNANQISSKVSKGEVKSIIEQNPESVKIGFNDINNSIEIDKDKMQFRDSAGNQSLSFMRGSLYAYEPNSSVFMGAGVIPRWNTGAYNAGFGVLASANSYYYSIARAANWNGDTQANPGEINEYLTVNYRDRSDAQKQGVYTYYKLYTSGGINGLGYDIENFRNIKCLDVYAGTWRYTDGTTILTCNGAAIASNKNWNFNSYTLSNLYLSNAIISSSSSVTTSLLRTNAYRDESNSEIFYTWGNGGNMTNSRNWNWGGYNLFNATMGYAIQPSTRDYKQANLDGVLDSISIYPSATTFNTEVNRSLEIDITELKNNENADLFIKQHETVCESGETEIVENIDMKSMLHLALYEIKQLKKEIELLKNTNYYKGGLHA